jgi:hypothetical protein
MTKSSVSGNYILESDADVKGLGLKDALYILENYGLEVTVTGKEQL